VCFVIGLDWRKIGLPVTSLLSGEMRCTCRVFGPRAPNTYLLDVSVLHTYEGHSRRLKYCRAPVVADSVAYSGTPQIALGT